MPSESVYYSGTLDDFGPCRKVIQMSEDGSNLDEVLSTLDSLGVLEGHSQNAFVIHTSLGPLDPKRFLVIDHKGTPRIRDVAPPFVTKEEWGIGHMMGEGDRRYWTREAAALDCDQGEYPVVRRTLSNGVIIDWQEA